MPKVKYVYDYPDQREIAKGLLSDDKTRMSELSGLSMRMVRCWCEGTRKNDKLMRLALRFSEINKSCFEKKEKVFIKK
jgi:hypothetical protein